MESMKQRFRDSVITLLLAVTAVAVTGSQTAPPTQSDPATTIRAETMLDGRGGVLRNVVIRVENGRIASVVQNGERVTYDLPGITIMPGWIDTHVHLASHARSDGRIDYRDETPAEQALYSAGNAWLTLQAGFTTVQSVGAVSDSDIKRAVASGVVPGPRVLTSVQQIGRVEPIGKAAELREVVRQLKAQGADLIKVIAAGSIREGGQQTMSAEQLEAACGEAKAQGLRSLVHVYTAQAMKDATLAGCTSIEHGTFGTDEVLRLMAARGTYYDPQIGLLFQNVLRVLRENNATARGFSDADIPQYEKARLMALDTFKRALRTPGLKIVFGTDANAGAHGRNVEEAIVRVQEGGQPAMAAIISMTSLAAESMGLQDHVGTIASGMNADLVGVVGNPLVDITALRRAVFVMRDGRIYKNVR
jgi:imidazolonepropionase-like amidohydrolase